MDAFLTFTHLGRTFSLTNVSPISLAPGQENVKFWEFTLAAQSQNQDKEVKIASEIYCKKIAHIFAEAFLRVDDWLYGPVYREYVVSPNSKVVNGVAYPQWESEVSVSHSFKLNLPVLTNGEQHSLGFAVPENYCLTESEQIYRVIGEYQFGEGGSPVKSRARFDAQGNLTSMTSFVERKGSKSFPKKVTPKKGDSFRPLVQRKRFVEITSVEQEDDFVLADILNEPGTLKRVQLPPLAGDYFVDFLVEDLDGNSYRYGNVLEIK